jgi:chromosome segregation protein
MRRSHSSLSQNLLRVLETKTRSGPSSRPTADVHHALGYVFGDITDAQVEEIYGRLDEAKAGACLAACEITSIKLDCRDRNTYFAFEKASPGQQASALLKLLLIRKQVL